MTEADIAAQLSQSIGRITAGVRVEKQVVARALMNLAEAHLQGAQGGSPVAPPTEAQVLHDVFAGAIGLLVQRGFSIDQVRVAMLTFAACWTAKAEGKAGVERLYRLADLSATKPCEKPH